MLLHDRRAKPSVAAALQAAALAAAMMIALGCKSTPEEVPLLAKMAPTLSDADAIEAKLALESQQWRTLDAVCDIVIVNPQIPTPGNRVTLRHGRITICKPGMVRIVAPATGKPALRMIGNGRIFRMEMPRFKDSYSGSYDERPQPIVQRIHFLPQDVIAAFDPVSLLKGKARTITQAENVSILYALDRVAEPEPRILITSAVSVNRPTNLVFAVLMNDSAGTVASRIHYVNVDTVSDKDRQPVRVPTRMLITYPGEQTSILLALRNVELNGEVDPNVFAVSELP